MTTKEQSLIEDAKASGLRVVEASGVSRRGIYPAILGKNIRAELAKFAELIKARTIADMQATITEQNERIKDLEAVIEHQRAMLNARSSV